MTKVSNIATLDNVTKWYKCNLVITKIIDRSTKRSSEKCRYRIGRKCFIYAAKVKIGQPLTVYCENGRYFKTSNIIDIIEDSYGVWFITLNSQYRFDYLY